MAKIGINHQILEASDPKLYTDWWAAASSWAKIIRLDPHMDAYAWQVDPLFVYNNGTRPMDSFKAITARCAAKKIDIDFIRDGASSSQAWRMLGGDWSTFDPPNTWRQHQLPTVAWSKTNAWINEAAKCLLSTKFKTRWQGPNETFDRGKDKWAYARMRNVYQTPLYARTWVGPALWGSDDQLLSQLSDWLCVQKLDQAFDAASDVVCVNLYGNKWGPSVTDTINEVNRKLDTVGAWAIEHDRKLILSECGFDKRTMPDSASYVSATQELIDSIQSRPEIDSATLYWDQGDYYLSPDQLSQLRVVV